MGHRERGPSLKKDSPEAVRYVATMYSPSQAQQNADSGISYDSIADAVQTYGYDPNWFTKPLRVFLVVGGKVLWEVKRIDPSL